MSSGGDFMETGGIPPSMAKIMDQAMADDDTLEDAERMLVEATVAPLGALNTQVGGNHYKEFFIQPVEFIHMNQLGFLEGCVIKRICRWREKDGVKDLRKAIHEIELLIEMEGLE